MNFFIYFKNRSEKMICKKICFPQENYDHVLEEMGKIENGVEIIDINQEIMESKKEFFQPINRCKEIEKKISKIERICQEFNFEIKKYVDIKKFYNDCKEDVDYYKKHSSPYFDIVENHIYEDEKKLDEFIFAKDHLIDEITENHERFYAFKNLLNSIQILGGAKILKINNKAYHSDYSINEENILNAQFLEEGHYEDNQLYLCGVVKSEEKMKFQRMIFRASFDRCNFSFMDIPDVRQKYIVDMEANKVYYYIISNKNFTIKVFYNLIILLEKTIR